MDARRGDSSVTVMSSVKNPGAPESSHRRLAQSRRWHKWGGVAAGLFLIVLGTTGIILNYKQPIFAALDIPTKRDRDSSPLPPHATSANVAFTTDGIAGGSVTFERALVIAKAEWGDVALERAEIRTERGGVIFRFRSMNGDELWVDAADGRHAKKGEYERLNHTESGDAPTRSTDWGKILIDLHTGKIGGEAGKAIVSIAGILLLLLTLSGAYMWLKPLLIRRENTRKQAVGGQSVVVVPAQDAADQNPVAFSRVGGGME